MTIESSGLVTISDIFHAAADLVQSSEPGGTSSIETKLKLYGLYKRCTVGRAEESSTEPARWNVVAHRKYMAWKECDSLLQEDAMLAYVETVAGLDGHVGDQCRSLMDAYFQQNRNVTEKIQSPEGVDRGLHEIACMKKKTKSIFEKYTGIQSFVPRGQLDISYFDLFHALVECLKSTIPFLEAPVLKQLRLEKSIAESWGALPSSKVHVGLSVRSLLDLYLSAKSYPRGSEVIVVPPIGIEGMMDVLHYHGIKIIPVDIDDYDDQRGPVISVNLDRVKGKISENTVAILVVHPFGLICTSDDEMKSLRLLCDTYSDQRRIEIWEDCAECFSGGYIYHGSPYANVQFYSFGTIKTSTALGGGICVLNQIQSLDVESISDKMRRVQLTTYDQQTRGEYLSKILKAFTLHIFSKNYILLGVLTWIFQYFRIDYDATITAAVKGFPTYPSVEDEMTGDSFTLCRATRLIRRLRKRPHPALMSLLLKRIHNFEQTKAIVKRRIRRCTKMKNMLHRYDPTIIVPDGHDRSRHLFWLFPFMTKEPNKLSKRLQSIGFDIPRGTSQLSCVTSFIEDPQSVHSCPNTERMMSQILYLPIASIPLNDSEIANLVSILKASHYEISDAERREKSRIRGILRPVYALPIILLFGGRYVDIPLISIVFGLGLYLVKMVVLSLMMILLILYTMRITLGHHYLRSTAYAKYNSIFNEPHHSQDGKTYSNRNHILDDYDPVKLPDFLQEEVEPSEKTKVMLAGATGFIGSLLLRDLLLHRKRLGLFGGVIVICRQKRNKSARERIDDLLKQEMFSFLTDAQKSDLVYVIDGDLSLPQFGMSDDDYYNACNLRNISLVINSAACVNFTEPLEKAAVSNISTALQLQDLTFKLKGPKYVYISTAFVHGDKTGVERNPLSEDLFDFGKYRPEDLFKSMMETQCHASAVMLELGFPNTYTFTKSVCEHLLMKQKMVHTIIIRPSIVGPSVQEPFEGWAGDKPSTLVAGACLYLRSPFNIWNFRRERAPVIPVDIVSRFILCKAFDFDQDSISDDSDASYCKDMKISETSSDYEHRERIYTAAWDVSSLDTTTFHWYDFACAIVQLGTANGHVSSVIAYTVILVSFNILLAVDLSFESFKKIHKIFVHGPLIMVSSLCEAFKIQSPLQKSIKKLQRFIDLPVLFFPFTTVTYYFRSELKVPDSFNSERYMFSCVVAAENFIHSMKVEGEGRFARRMNDSKAVIAGSNSKPPKFDLIWSLMQPAGNFAIRFAGYIVIKILRVVSTKVQVDLTSLSEVQRNIYALKRRQGHEYNRIHIILAPTHRSVLDFILISFVAFSLPETGLQIPMIAASDEFANIPIVGILAQWAGAFFLSRGKGRADPSLQKKVLSLKDAANDTGFVYFEVFLEGKRSRDRRFLVPKTGFLRCLHESGGTHVIVPITINYERIPEQKVLIEEACGNSKKVLRLSDLMVWLKDAFLGNISLGKIDISFATSLVVHEQCHLNLNDVTNQIQILQRNNIMVSNYHIRAAACILELDPKNIRRSLKHLQSKLWDDEEDISINTLELPSSSSELWSVFLQFAHLYAPYLMKSHPKWAVWLSSNMPCKFDERLTESSDIMEVVGVLRSIFDVADSCVLEATALLFNKGFNCPSHAHILQYTEIKRRWSCEFIVRVAIVLNHEEKKKSYIEESSRNIGVEPLFHNSSDHRDVIGKGESFGAWGYNDSKFVVFVEKSGVKKVQMKGDRYIISGRNMPKLIPFLEHETKINFDPHKISLSPHPNISIACTDLSDHSLRALYESVSGDKDRVTTVDKDRVRHGTGHSQEDMFIIRSRVDSSKRMPDAVVYPTTEKEVENIVALAAQKNWCLIPFGGGTNVSHATWCPPKELDPRPMISIDLRLMDSILSLNEEDRTVHVQAGITGGKLIREMLERGFTIGHEPDSLEFSTVGGWIATKASGMKQNKYGNIEDIVQNVHVISALGKLLQNDKHDTPSFARVSTGTNLTSLMLGSEGTLGVITSAVLKIWPLAEIKEYESVILHSFDDGLRFVKDISNLGALKPASVRLLDNTQFRLGQSMTSNDSPLDHLKRKCVSGAWTFIGNKFDTLSMVCATIAFEGSVSEVSMQRGKVKSIAASHGGFCAGSKVGRAGYDMTFAIAYIRDFAMTHGFLAESFETFVPWSKVNTLVNATKDRLRKEHNKRALPGQPIVTCRITQLYDQGVCVYFYFCMNFDGVQNPSSVFSDIELAAREEILAQGGSLSHHHGIGKHRAPFMNQVNNSNFKNVLMSFKSAMDPNNVFGVRNGSYA